MPARRQAPQPIKGQRGIALLMVLVIVAIATVLTVGMISAQQQSVRRAGSLFAQDQAQLYALGAEDFVKELIRNDTEDDKKNSTPRDTLNEAWARPFPAFPVPGGVIRARLQDAQARFNLNSLVQENTVNQGALHYFQRLLRQLNYPETLAYAVVDWEDADSQPNNLDGAEDDYYTRLTPSYRAANRPLSSLSELRLVRGFTPDIIQALQPYVVVLPATVTTINVNTMGGGMMSAMVDGMSKSAGDEMMRSRPADGYKTVDDFLASGVFNSLSSDQKTELKTILGVRTQYFELIADVEIDERHCVMASMIQRGDSGTLAVISRDFGRKLPSTDNDKQAAANTNGTTLPAGN